MNSYNFNNKVAFITGGAQGIGAGLATAFVGAGAKVVIADVDDATGQLTAAEIGATYLHLDVTDYAANQAAITQVLDTHGRLDIAVFNAGVTSGTNFGPEFDERLYRRAMSVNLDAVVFGINAALPALRENGGEILVTASMAGLAPSPLDPIYAANKTALVGLVRSFGVASAVQNVRTNAVCPAFARTGLIAESEAGLAAAGVPLLEVAEVVDTYLQVLDSGRSGDCWFVQAGRPSQPFAFRGAPGPRLADGSPAPAADPNVQLAIRNEVQ